jgi:hypothetical protein
LRHGHSGAQPRWWWWSRRSTVPAAEEGRWEKECIVSSLPTFLQGPTAVVAVVRPAATTNGTRAWEFGLVLHLLGQAILPGEWVIGDEGIAATLPSAAPSRHQAIALAAGSSLSSSIPSCCGIWADRCPLRDGSQIRSARVADTSSSLGDV